MNSAYRGRPRDELYITVSAAHDANYSVLVENDFGGINAHIEWITDLGLKGEFSLSEIQHAYELYRTILVPILLENLHDDELLRAVERLNRCVFYTITRFSDYFQAVHEKQIRDHAHSLELEVKKRTKELAESESKYRVLVEEINDGYFVNQEGTIVFANKAYCDLHGYTWKDVVGRSYTDMVDPSSMDLVKELYERRDAGEEIRDLYVYLRRHRNGTALPTENKVKRIVYKGKYAVAGVCRDITERIESEQRLREAERLAHIGKLTTSLAHEIRNPLSSVKMYSQIILKNTGFQGNDKRRMEIVVAEISRLERILDEMLDFAKPLRLQFEPVTVHNVINTCLEILSEKIRESGVTVTRRYAKGEPSLPLDKERMEQAIINVLLNAVDMLDKNGKIEISTHVLSRKGRTVRIDIGDNGPGMKQEDLPYAFDPFFSNKAKGTGLGLTNVKKIIEAHGGTVDLALRKPHGLRLRITLPFGEAR